jgi:glycosyltransferase involved in cell wall biosynthesis
MAHGSISKRSLRIAFISGCGHPNGLGELARELRLLGHRPALFTPEEPARTRDSLAALRHAEAAWAQVDAHEEFDLVHVGYPEAIAFTKVVPVPTVATVFHARDVGLLAHYQAHPDVALVAVSRRQAELAWEVPFRAVIHHGLDVERYPLGKGGRRYAFVGPLAPESGPHLAIEAAQLARSPLALGGEIANESFFARTIAPRLTPGISLAGILDHMRLVSLLSGSRALLAPLQSEEPFSLTMIESMLVGTPVIAYACGAAPEIVEDGVTGFLVHNVEEMSRRMRDVGSIDRKACRAHARSRWSAARMARKYEALYVEIDDRWRSKKAGTVPSSDRSGVVAAGAPTPTRMRAV